MQMEIQSLLAALGFAVNSCHAEHGGCDIEAQKAGAAKAEIIDQDFDNVIAEPAIHKQVVRFQKALDAMPDGKDPESLARQVETQLNIKEMVLKGREAQSAQWVPFFPIGSSIIGGLIGGLVPALIGRRLSKEKTKEKPRDNP